MKKTILIVMILSLASKIIGFIRELTLSYYYGASNISDAYLISLTIPTVIFAFIATGIKTVFIPIYSEIYNQEGKKNADFFTSKVIVLTILLSTAIIIFGIIFMEPLINIFAVGFDSYTVKLTSQLTTISLLSICFMGTVYILEGYLQLKGKFIITTLITFPLNLFLILSIPLSYYFGVRILGYGRVLAVLSQLLILIPFLKNEQFRIKYKLKYKLLDDNVKRVIMLSLPIILGTSVNQINKIVDRTIASRIAIGGISALVYANRLNGLIQGIFVLSIVNVLYPKISNLASKNKIDELKSVLRNSILGINILVLPASVGLMFFSKEIVSLLFSRGAFNLSALEMTSGALFFYTIGMIAIGLRDILSKVFYSIKDTRTPVINSSLGMIMNIIFNIILSTYFGISGLALATSISASFTTFLLFMNLRKKLGPLGIRQISISFLKILFSSLVMGGVAKWSFNYLLGALSQNLSLLVAIGVGAVSYFVMIYFMKIEDVDVFINIIKQKITLKQNAN